MRRRDFIAGLGGAAASPIAARAQQGGPMRRIGVLINSAATDVRHQSYVAAFVETLRQLGWNEGNNLHVEVRWNAADPLLAKIYAAQLMGLMPDAILVASTANLTAIRQATNTVPVVFIAVSDPVAQGFVVSLSHPGGNITGFTNTQFSVGSKWLDLLKKVAPNLTRVAVMFNPDTSPQSKFYMQAIEAAAPSLGLKPIPVSVRGLVEIESALEKFGGQPDGGLVLPSDSFTNSHRVFIAELALRYRLPLIAATVGIAKDGGLMDYGVNSDLLSQYRQAAGYVDRMLKGERPGDLPVQGADHYRFVINLNVAKALGLDVPPTLLALADAVIE